MRLINPPEGSEKSRRQASKSWMLGDYEERESLPIFCYHRGTRKGKGDIRGRGKKGIIIHGRIGRRLRCDLYNMLLSVL